MPLHFLNRVPLSVNQVNWYMRHGLWLALTGLVLIVVGVQAWRDFGFVSGLMLVLFGLDAWGFRFWLREKGLWMLALLSLGAWTALYCIMEYDAIKRHLLAPNPRLMLLGVDTAIAASILWAHIRFLVTVALLNWKVFRPTVPAEVPASR